MSINHKIFRFTQIADKTNDIIFLKIPKTLLLGHFLIIFGHFRPMQIFSKNPALPHSIIYKLLTPCQVSEKTNEPIPRKLTYRQKDRWKDKQALFYRTLLTRIGGSTRFEKLPYSTLGADLSFTSFSSTLLSKCDQSRRKC